MDDGDIDFTNPETYLRSAMDNYFNDILKDPEHLACCNPHVRHDLAPHTQTRVHLQAESDDVAETSESPQENNGPKKRPAGNQAAVRRYREKKKAHTTLLEEEVARLKALNKHLLRRLQSHSALEAEVSRLRCLLVDIRGRIEGELGAFPYQQQPVKSNDPVYCSQEMQSTTMDDDGVMSGELFGQGAGEIANNQWLPGLPDDVKR